MNSSDITQTSRRTPAELRTGLYGTYLEVEMPRRLIPEFQTDDGEWMDS